MLVKFLQPLKAPIPIEVTPEGMVTAVKLVQSINAPSPIEVTDEGMSTRVRLRHS
jgi:hypothetical protein